MLREGMPGSRGCKDVLAGRGRLLQGGAPLPPPVPTAAPCKLPPVPPHPRHIPSPRPPTHLLYSLRQASSAAAFLTWVAFCRVRCSRRATAFWLRMAFSWEMRVTFLRSSGSSTTARFCSRDLRLRLPSSLGLVLKGNAACRWCMRVFVGGRVFVGEWVLCRP